MHRTAVLNVVGLSQRLIGGATPHIQSFLDGENIRLAKVKPVLPAVTCSAQATYLTGLWPSQHGIVGNGWYERDYAEHRFWKQSNRLVHGTKLWESLRADDPDFTCAKLFWWFNMFSTADFSITPRPIYCADGNKVFDVTGFPANLPARVKKHLGPFPFPHFWGPMSDIRSTAWIAESAKWVEDHHWPGLSLVYLPHLDYNFQRLGPNHPDVQNDLRDIDRVVGDLIRFYTQRNVKVVLLSEYSITEVSRPVHLNRIFRRHGWISVKDELGRESLELGACRAFAIADHQAAHVYVNDHTITDQVRAVLESTEGVEEVFHDSFKHYNGIDHPRSGDFVVLADPGSWFTYYYWEDDALAPDYARTVDIHRKCGYDPVELFLDPSIRSPKRKLAGKLIRKKLGLRTLFDVIPLDASLVKGSHGRLPESPSDWPVLAGEFDFPKSGQIAPTDVFGYLRNLCSSGHGYELGF